MSFQKIIFPYLKVLNNMKTKTKKLNNPLVSIVTTSYNTDKYIEANIKSVCNQNYKNFEHIIVDANSTDNTKNILKKYKHLTWISEDDSGQSEGINKGFSMVSGDYVIWLNSDDTLTKKSIIRSLEFFKNNSVVDFISSDINIINENDKKIGLVKGEEINIKNILSKNPIKQPSVMFRSKILKEIGNLDENLHYTMDREFWLRIFINGYNMKYVSGVINANFRLCPGTKTFDGAPNFRKEWNIVLIKNLHNKKLLSYVRLKYIKKVIKLNKSSYYLSLMTSFFNNSKKCLAIGNIFKIVYYNPKILYNLGFYKKIILGILSIKYLRISKYHNENI